MTVVQSQHSMGFPYFAHNHYWSLHCQTACWWSISKISLHNPLSMTTFIQSVTAQASRETDSETLKFACRFIGECSWTKREARKARLGRGRGWTTVQFYHQLKLIQWGSSKAEVAFQWCPTFKALHTASANHKIQPWVIQHTLSKGNCLEVHSCDLSIADTQGRWWNKWLFPERASEWHSIVSITSIIYKEIYNWINKNNFK